MQKLVIVVLITLGLAASNRANAAFTLSLDSQDFGIASVFNDVSSFRFTIAVDEDLVPGTTYVNPTLASVHYTVNGVLNDPTPSMFPGFALVRTVSGAEFYSLSPDAMLSFSVDGGADLSDGLQFNELSGTGTVFALNAREFNQSPGRYHPPILTLDADGTGRLVNANNQSTVPNPSNGLLVNVDVGQEYDVALSFSTGLTIVPEPNAILLMLSVSGVFFVRRSRTKGR